MKEDNSEVRMQNVESGPAAPAGAPVPAPGILPCPFCGSPGTLYSDEHEHKIACTKEACGVQPHSWWFKDRSAAIAAWNTRTPESIAPDPRKGTPIDLGTFTLDASDLLQWLRDNQHSGVAAIMNERERQIHVKGYTATYDERRGDGSLAQCAGLICMQETDAEFLPGEAWQNNLAAHATQRHSRIRQLAIAGALIAAEIDRLTRLQSSSVPSSSSASSAVKTSADQPDEHDRPIAPPRNHRPRPYA